MFVIPESQDKDPDGVLYQTDNVQTYFNLILPTTCSPTPIQTGVTIYRNTTGSTTTDAICPNPGCSYTGSTCS
jgi:hypothetical protein